MSHYAVAVIHRPNQDIEELLAPYSEHIKVEPYINRTKEQMIADGKERLSGYLKRLDDLKKESYYESQIVPYLNAKTDEDFYNLQRYDDAEYDDDGNELTTYNPKSKWDWYQVGGRFSGMLRVNDTEALKTDLEDEYDNYVDDGIAFCDSAPINTVDFSMDEEHYERSKRWFEVVVEGKKPRNAEEKEWDTFYKPEYLKERYLDADTYARECAEFSTFSVVTPDGEWHEAGAMGWFGCSTETPEDGRAWHRSYYDTFIANADPNDIITIVDCHI